MVRQFGHSSEISLTREIPVEVTLFPPIPTHGAVDAHSDFELVGTPEVRERVAAAAEELMQVAAPERGLGDICVSCFSEPYGPDALAAADAYKLSVRSKAAGAGQAPTYLFAAYGDYESSYTTLFAGDDSNAWNVTERDIQGLRRELVEIGDRMAEIDSKGILTASHSADAAEQIARINRQIAELQTIKAKSNVPVYFATPFEGLCNDMGEDNPLAYAGELPGAAHLAFYDRAALDEVGIQITEKTDAQLRIYGHGQEIMNHCVAIMHVPFEDSPTA
jgi:hypothetical protein